jgi:homogentisate 1,2-dioxygenase
VYDLMDFSPIANARVDHVDPSAHVVVHTPLDEIGASCLDFVAFVPRWDPSERTFKPPYFHRNVITEVNGIISDPTLGSASRFSVGMTFATPSHTPHGIMTRGVERALHGDDKAVRVPDGSLWFQFESALPLHFSRWAATAPTRIADWPTAWGAYRAHFDPRG